MPTRPLALFGHVLCAAVLSFACAQDGRHRPMRVCLPDRTVEAYALNKRVSSGFDPNKEYHWCRGQRVFVTQGGADGDLLDGTYTEFHTNGQLRTKGVLSKGVKTGVWHEWDEHGRLLVLSHWKNGTLHGAHVRYDSAGGEPVTERYRKGKLVQHAARKERKKRAPRSEQRTGPEEKPEEKVPAPEPAEVKRSKRLRERDQRNKGTKEEVLQERNRRSPTPSRP